MLTRSIHIGTLSYSKVLHSTLSFDSLSADAGQVGGRCRGQSVLTSICPVDLHVGRCVNYP